MVGADYGDSSVKNGFSQGISVAFALDGRIAFDSGAKTFVIGLCINKVCHTGFSCNLGIGCLAKEFNFCRCTQMRYVKLCVVLEGKIDRQLRAHQAGLGITNVGMLAHVGVITPTCFHCLLHVSVDTICVLAVCHNERAALTEDLVKRSFVIYEHIACAASHKELNAGDAGDVCLRNVFYVIKGCTEEKGIIDLATALCQRIALFQQGKAGCLGRDVWHVKDGCNPTGRRSTRFGYHVSLVGKSRIPHVHMVINHTRYECHALHVKNFILWRGRIVSTAHHFLYLISFNNKGANIVLPFVDDIRIQKNGSHFLGFILLIRNLTTPNSASLKIPPLILLVPNSRLTKITGTSLTLNPRQSELYFISIWKA